AHALEFGEFDAARSGDARAVLADRSRSRSAKGGEGETGAGAGARCDTAAGVGDDGAEGGTRAGGGEKAWRGTQCRASVRQAQTARRRQQERVNSFARGSAAAYIQN